jgi:hypothetical protein
MRAQWQQTALIAPLTWRDEAAPWPKAVGTDRSSVQVPESWGVRLNRDDDEAEFVVWTGGLADIGLLFEGEVTDLHAEFQDVDGAYAAVVRTAEDLLA